MIFKNKDLRIINQIITDNHDHNRLKPQFFQQFYFSVVQFFAFSLFSAVTKNQAPAERAAT